MILPNLLAREGESRFSNNHALKVMEGKVATTALF
jgi:hypothetical protein